MNRIIYIILFSFLFIQCEDDKHIAVSNKNVEGRYIHLEAENIYLYVPKKVKLYSNDEYVQYINGIENKQFRKMERARYLQMKYGSAGNFYIMASEDSEIDVTFRTVPYIPINKEVSQEILKYLNRDHKAGGRILGLESSFSRAGIIKKGDDRIFRAIFLYKGIDLLTGKNAEIYTYFYLVNREGKSFVLSFNSRKAYDFDSYVQKIRL